MSTCKDCHYYFSTPQLEFEDNTTNPGYGCGNDKRNYTDLRPCINGPYPKSLKVPIPKLKPNKKKYVGTPFFCSCGFKIPEPFPGFICCEKCGKEHYIWPDNLNKPVTKYPWKHQPASVRYDYQGVGLKKTIKQCVNLLSKGTKMKWISKVIRRIMMSWCLYGLYLLVVLCNPFVAIVGHSICGEKCAEPYWSHALGGWLLILAGGAIVYGISYGVHKLSTILFNEK